MLHKNKATILMRNIGVPCILYLFTYIILVKIEFNFVMLIKFKGRGVEFFVVLK